MYNSRAFNLELHNVKHPIRTIAITAALLTAANAVLAQEDAEYEVVLPEAAQACVLPTAPDAIPEDADRDQLLAAKQAVGDFQTEVESYRSCLSNAEAGDITPGNKQAIVASYNYSVEMEERVATRFNEAVRAYKERQSDG